MHTHHHHHQYGWGWGWIGGEWDDLRLEREPHWHWHWYWWRPAFRPGNVPYRLRAWQPDLTGHTTEAFRRRFRIWLGRRVITPPAGTPPPVEAAEMPNLVVFNLPGTFAYQPSAGLTAAIIEVVAGGGGGGWANVGTGTAGAGGGGGSGGYS
ncbi:MAG: hypothetical protein J2P16_01105, partial [Mycobacterium sp.]|nr:hypothetical protein [Mycobacterium sp.]